MEGRNKKEINVSIGELLREARTNCDLSQNDVAERLGVSRVMIHHYETGRSAISVEQLIKICNIYNIDYIDLLRKA